MKASSLIRKLYLAYWFSTTISIFICSFPDIHLFLINFNLLQFCNHLWTFSSHFCLFTNRFCSFLLNYQLLLLVSTHLSFTSCLYSFMSRSNHFYSFTQDSTSFVKLDLKNGFHEIKSSLASHPITTFQIKKRKKCCKSFFFFFFFLHIFYRWYHPYVGYPWQYFKKKDRKRRLHPIKPYPASIIPDRSTLFPWPNEDLQHSLSLWTQQTILTRKRISIIQGPQSYCKALEQSQIESNFLNRMHDLPFTRL